MNVYGLGQQHPGWAVELLAAWLVERPEALDLDPSGKIAALASHEHSLRELATNAAQGGPLAFCQQMVPYLQCVMSRTEGNPAQPPVTDQHFSHRLPDAGPAPSLDDVLLHGAAAALRAMVQQDPDAIQLLLETLAHDPHDSAQWLLYEALRTDGARYADWAAGLLLEGEHRFRSGYLSDGYWTTRQLLAAITPHMSEQHFRRLESAVMTLRPPWEDQQSAGHMAFELLSGMDEARLSAPAKRRLGELRRKFHIDQPSAPKHSTDKTDYATLTGGVHELSQLLRTEATNDPSRFARLASRLTPDLPPPYANAILEALGQTNESVEPALVFDAVRHVAGFNKSGNDSSLSLSLRKQLDSDVPGDVIQLVLDWALHAPHPTEEAWSQRAPGGQYYYNGDILTGGINTARGQAAATLGDLMAHDTDGHRTALVAPSLTQLAQDPSVAVRSCVAHLLAASLRYATDEALAAYEYLIDTDDRLLATEYCKRLTLYIGMGRPEVIGPVIERMVVSVHEEVRKAGGFLAAFSGLEFGLPQLLTAARESSDASTRQGAAELCALRLPYTSDAAAATEALQQFVSDPDEDVRKSAAQVAATLRNYALQPFSELLRSLIASEAFTEALPQLLITLQAAPDRIDDMVIATSQRFVNVYGEVAGDISTSAAGEASEAARLIVRAYAQALDRDTRRKTLNLIDELLVIHAVGAPEALDAAER